MPWYEVSLSLSILFSHIHGQWLQYGVPPPNFGRAYSLAYAELYMTIASFVRRFDMELYETTMDDIRIGRELGIAQPKGGELSVRAKVTNIVKE